MKCLIESAVGGPDMQGSIENQQWFAHRVHNVQSEILNIVDELIWFHCSRPSISFVWSAYPIAFQVGYDGQVLGF